MPKTETKPIEVGEGMMDLNKKALDCVLLESPEPWFFYLCKKENIMM